MVVKPLRGLRPRRDLASSIPSYPYDVVGPEEAREIARENRYSFLHVVRAEVDLEPGVDPMDDRVYAKARENFLAMLDRGWLLRDEMPAYYLYRLAQGGHIQTGIVGVVAVDEYLEGRIRRHEHTHPDRETDRARHIEALSTEPGPVVLAHRGVAELDGLVEGLAAREPEADFASPDGIRHTLWVVNVPDARRRIGSLLEAMHAAYVADGHHRAAAAARVAVKRRQSDPAPTGQEPYDFFLAVLFPAQELRILGYNRLVRDLNGLAPTAFLDRLRRAGFGIEQGQRSQQPPRRGVFGMYLDGGWFLLLAPPAPSADVVRSLDVSVLEESLLRPVLGIGDPRTDRRIEFVGGVRAVEEVERRVDSGEHAVGFVLHPASIEDVIRVADAGRVMPPKSTWFEPKPRTGMVIHTF